MRRSDLAKALAHKHPDLRASLIEKALDAFFEEIVQQLANGGRVELRGFGAFSARSREARTGRNPKSGDLVEVPPKRVPHFRPGKDMRERLADGD